jgi:hypothetical protein
MEYLFKFDATAVNLLMEALGHLPINRALGLMQAMQSEVTRQEAIANSPPAPDTNPVVKELADEPAQHD